jgi:hypothetical protein
LEPTTGKLKYLLYLDILGFKELIKERTPEDIYNIIDKCLAESYEEVRFTDLFSTLYFSDTIIFYQTSEMSIFSAFFVITGIARGIYTKLLTEGIPVRGAISFGEFIVKLDSEGRNSIYFGDALIDAFDLEKKDEWVGIVISSLAYNNVLTDLINSLNDIDFVKREDGCLLLNPFVNLLNLFLGHFDNSEHGIDCSYELKALKFLLSQEKKYSLKAPCRVFSKYSNTVAFIKRIMKDGAFEKAENMIKEYNI